MAHGQNLGYVLNIHRKADVQSTFLCRTPFLLIRSWRLTIKAEASLKKRHFK